MISSEFYDECEEDGHLIKAVSTTGSGTNSATATAPSPSRTSGSQSGAYHVESNAIVGLIGVVAGALLL